MRAELDALAADKARLEDTVRTQDALLTAVAHDLKNSLAAVTMRADLLQEQLHDDSRAAGVEGSTSVREGLARIQATSSNMARLLDELLGLARMQAGHRLDLVREPIDLVALARRVAGEYLDDQPVQDRIQVDTTESELIGSWDAWRLERVLRNLLSNALKYSPQGGEIRLRIGRERDAAGEWAILAISDHGLGIPDSDLVAVFERFHRGANVRGRIGGSGIGLAGARQIVQEHGGSLTVQSQEGVGSTFTVRLPLSPALDRPRDAPARTAADADPMPVLNVLSGVSLLGPIPLAGLTRLAEQSSIRAFAAGTVLVEQGDTSESFFLLVNGRVRVERSRALASKPLMLAELGAGEVVGEMGALNEARRSATVTALENTLAVEIPATALADILLRYHEVATGLLRGLSRRLRVTDESMEQVSVTRR
jgi:nitrogen-specific signal transduction histidine kinase